MGWIESNSNSYIFLKWLYWQGYNIVTPLFITFAKCLEGVVHHQRSIFFGVPYWLPYSTDKFISCVCTGPLQWFFHFVEEIVITWNQEKTTRLGGTEPHQPS